MEKTTKEVKERFLYDCTDYIWAGNDSSLRQRWCFLMPTGQFVCVENNTAGWFIESTIRTFSGGVSWVRMV